MSANAVKPGPSRGVFQGGVNREAVGARIADYAGRFDETAAARAANDVEVAKSYYQLVTDFYEYGWGRSFHFAPRDRGEGVKASLARYERDLGLRLAVGPGQRLLDVGCGVGGPMRTIARATGADVTGVSISPYQIERARLHNEQAGLGERCQVVEGDFNQLAFEPESFDAAYTIEACCHADQRRRPFEQVFRVLRPGAIFAGTDWCLTDRFLAGDPRDERVKLGIERGNGVATLHSTRELQTALKESGFEILEARDLASASGLPWYQPLRAGFSMSGFRNSRSGAFLTHQLVKGLEAAGISPKGTVQVHDVLRLAQRALVEGGETGIFTPIYYWVAQKPGASHPAV